MMWSLVASLLVSDASACSCAFRLERTVLPEAGSVPPEVRFWVLLDGPFLEEVRAAAARDGYRLVGPDGVVDAELSLDDSGHHVALVPRQPLTPGADYTLEERVARLPDGATIDIRDPWRDEAQRLLTDEAVHVLELARRRQGTSVALEETWVAVARYHVEAGQRPVPLPPRQLKAEYHYRYGGGDCGPGTALHLELQPSDGAVLYEIEQRGRGVIALEPARGPDGEAYRRLGVGDLHCYAPSTPFVRDGRYTVRVTAVGAGGERSPSGWVDAVATRDLPEPGPAGAVVQEIVADAGGAWVATSAGVLRLSDDGGIEARYTAADGLPDDLVLSVAAYGERLWAVTRSGPAILEGARFVPVFAAQRTLADARERQWAQLLEREALASQPARPGEDGDAWQRLLDGAWRLQTGVDDQGALWLGLGGAPSGVIRCTSTGCDTPPYLGVGGPGAWHFQFLAAGEGAIFMRSWEHYVGANATLPQRARPVGLDMWKADTEGVLRYRGGQFEERPLPKPGCIDVVQMLPTGDRFWVLGRDRCSETHHSVLLLADDQGRIFAEHALDEEPDLTALRWAADGERLLLVHSGRLWQAPAGEGALAPLELPGIAPSAITALALSKQHLWIGLPGAVHRIDQDGTSVTVALPKIALDRDADLDLQLTIPAPLPASIHVLRKGEDALVQFETTAPPREGIGALGAETVQGLLDVIEREGLLAQSSPPYYFNGDEDHDPRMVFSLAVGGRPHVLRVFALGDGEPAAFGRLYDALMALPDAATPIPDGDDRRRWFDPPPQVATAPLPAPVPPPPPAPDSPNPLPGKPARPVPAGTLRLPTEPTRCNGAPVVEVQDPAWRFVPADTRDVWFLAAMGHVYVVAGRLVYALEGATGAVAWTHDLHDAIGAAPPVLVDDVLVVPLEGGRTVVALEAATGQLRWDRKAASAHPLRPFRAHVAAGQGAVWLVDQDGLYKLAVHDGAVLGHQPRVYARGNPTMGPDGEVWTQALGDELEVARVSGEAPKLRIERWQAGDVVAPDFGNSGLFLSERGVVWVERGWETPPAVAWVRKRRFQRFELDPVRIEGVALGSEDTLILSVADPEGEVDRLVGLSLPSGRARPKVRWVQTGERGTAVAAAGDRALWQADHRLQERRLDTGCLVASYGRDQFEPYHLYYSQPAQLLGDRVVTVTQDGQVLAFSRPERR